MRALFLAVVWLAGCAGASTPPTRCFLAVDTTRSVSAKQWMDLLLWRTARSGMNVCTGAPIVAESRAGCGAPSTRARERAVDASSVAAQQTDDGGYLVWVKTHAHADGTQRGPLAIISKRKGGWGVDAIGVIRAFPDRPRMRLSDDEALVIVESEHCRAPNDLASCHRSAWLVVRRGQQLLAPPVHGPEGGCLGPAAVDLHRDKRVQLSPQWVRRFALASSYELQLPQVTLHEQMKIEDLDPSQPSIPPRPFRQIDGVRTLHWTGTLWRSSKPPLWQRAVEQFGSVQESSQP